MPKPKIPNQRKANLEHKKRVEKYALLIQQVYDRVAKEAARQAVLAGADPDKQFSFSDYPLTKEAIKNLQTQLMSEVRGIIMAGTSSEWKESNLVQDLVAKRVLTAYTGTSKHGDEYSRYFETNPDSLKAFQERKDRGMNLSTRVWNLSEQYKQELEESITAAIAPGTSAMELASQVKKYLKEPDKRFRRIKEKMEDGTIKWHLSKNAKAYHPGQGVYRSSARNAQRLARTEINMSYRTAEQERWKQFDFVVGYEVKTTQNGKHVEDMCDMLAGKYPKTFKFTGWHPMCMCYCIPILKTEDEFWSLYDDAKSVNEVADVPQNFKEWIRDNSDRINKAEKRGNLPYFIRDNKDDVERILHPRDSSETTESYKRPLPKLPENPSQEDIRKFITTLADNEGWFGQYDNGVSVILDERLRGAVASADRENATIYLKPSESLFKALYRISNGEELTYENANNLATIWHEINHMRHIGIDKATGGPYSGGIGASAMELANEYYSRKTLPEFFKALGYDEMPFLNMVNRRNTGYNRMVELYDYVVKRKFGLDENAVLKRIEYGLFNEPYNNQVAVLIDALKSGGLRAKDSQIEKLVLKMCQYGKEPTPDKLSDLIDKMKYSIVLPSPHYGAAMKLGSISQNRGKRLYEHASKTILSKELQENIRECARELNIPLDKVKPMTFNQANYGRGNADFGNGKSYEENCAMTIAVHEARLRGLNITSLGYDSKIKEMVKLSRNFESVWEDPYGDLSKHEVPWFGDKKYKAKDYNPKRNKTWSHTDDEVIDKMKSAMSEPGRYHIGINWMEKAGNGEWKPKGHVIVAEKLPNNEIVYYDCQRGIFVDINEWSNIQYIELLRVDNLKFNKRILSKVVRLT